MWNTNSAIECGNPCTWRAANSAERSSTQARGSAWAPLPWSSSVRARDDIDAALKLLAVRGKVLLFQNRAVVQLVARDDVRQTAHADFIFIGDAAPHPDLFIEIAQQRKRCAAHGDEIFDRVGEGVIRERTIAHIIILLEALEGRSIGTRDSHGAIGEDSLRIADVTQHFLSAPLARRISEVPIGFVAGGKQQHHLPPLLVKRIQNFLASNQGNIALVIRRVLPRLRTSDLER